MSYQESVKVNPIVNQDFLTYKYPLSPFFHKDLYVLQ